MMSTRKMRLVSEALYKKLINENTDPTEKLVAEKQEILQSKTIPDDVKPQLYHQTIRKISNRTKEANERPVELSLRTDFKKPQEKHRRQLLETFLAINGVTQDSDGKLVVDGTSHATMYDRAFNRLLGIDSDKTSLAGLKAIQDKLHNAGLPKRFFFAKQWGGGGMRPKTKRVMRKKCVVEKKDVKKIIWKSY